ncbi:hypothetical protein [Nocardia sp. NPDC005998]|uniref:hypothetical protein n=1 Tax=Nocardia sp. NPDC005998 TaxID=3156894 RepID=UPI0033A436E4
MLLVTGTVTGKGDDKAEAAPAMALDCVPGVWQGRIVMRATWDTGTDEGRNETIPTFIQC